MDHIEDESLDFVYIDARHDYCSVAEDMALYWPKLRQGGILAGHDYMLAHNLRDFVSGPDRYDICPDGSIRERSVKGAVDDFLRARGLQLAVTFNDQPPWLSWIARKPCGSTAQREIWSGDKNMRTHRKIETRTRRSVGEL